jgi:hypothetical protein
MKLITFLFTCLAIAFASETLIVAIEKLKSFEIVTPFELLSHLQSIKTEVHGVCVAGSSHLITELVDSGLVGRIVHDYSVETFEEVLDLDLFSQAALFASFTPIQASLSAAHPVFKHYKLLCKRLALSLTSGSETFSIAAVDMIINLGLKNQLLREVLFGLLTFRTFKYTDLIYLLGSDPFLELARAEYFEVLLAVIEKFGIPPESLIQSAEFGPERQSLKDFTSTINPALSGRL